MKTKRTLYAAALSAVLFVPSVFAADQEFDADKMLSDLEQQLTLSGDALARLKPAIDEKSAVLKKSINESVEQGFVQLGELTQQLDEATREAEAKMREVLTSEEMQQLKEYLSKIDREAIVAIQERLVAELEKLLKLTEDQIAKIRPVLEDAFNQLGEMLDRLVREGGKSLERFRAEYEGLNKDLRQKLGETLDGEQLKSLDEHRDELQQSIREALFPGQ